MIFLQGIGADSYESAIRGFDSGSWCEKYIAQND